MAEGRRRRRRSREIIAGDIDVMPLMNLFIVLIPLLLLSAVFIEVAVIDMALPSASAAANESAERLDLSVRIDGAAYVVEANGLAPQRVERAIAGSGSFAPDDATRGRLSAVLRDIAAAHPDQRDLKIVSGPTTRYEEIVALMDVARDAGLPNTTLAGAGDGAI
jgi:biopolymer transport protein ExbD